MNRYRITCNFEEVIEAEDEIDAENKADYYLSARLRTELIEEGIEEEDTQ